MFPEAGTLSNTLDENGSISKGGSDPILVDENFGMFLRPEQKSIRLMMEMVAKFSGPGDMVYDPNGGTFATAKACLNLHKHRKFFGCDFDERCVEIAILRVLQTFVKQLTSPLSDITASAEEIDFDIEFLAHPNLEAREAAQHASLWDAPPGLPMYQRLPIHVHRYLSCMIGDVDMALKNKNTPPDLWPSKPRAFLNTVDAEALMSLEAAAKGFVVCKSTIRHTCAGKGVFAIRSFKKGEDILTYNGTVVYKNLSAQNATTKVYGSVVLGVRKKRFADKAVELRSKAVDDKDKEHPTFIVPAPFWVAGYINDPRYLPDDRDEVERHTKLYRTANVRFVESVASPSKHKLRSNGLVVIETIREIRTGEELFLDYGKSFVQWGSTPSAHGNSNICSSTRRE